MCYGVAKRLRLGETELTVTSARANRMRDSLEISAYLTEHKPK